MPKLYGPEGGVIAHDEKDVTSLTREEIITFSKMQEIAQKHGISLVCRRCDKSFMGQNNDSSSKLSVSCGCRELRYTRG